MMHNYGRPIPPEKIDDFLDWIKIWRAVHKIEGHPLSFQDSCLDYDEYRERRKT